MLCIIRAFGGRPGREDIGKQAVTLKVMEMVILLADATESCVQLALRVMFGR